MDTKSLRQKILSLAIQGKLTAQDHADEPASKLLERIRQAREQQAQGGKRKSTKATKATSDVANEDKPFDIPETWEWCALGDLCAIKGGKRIPQGMAFSNEKTAHIYLRVSDMKRNTIVLSDLKYISDDIYECIKNYTINSTDLYLTIAGTIGVVGVVPNEVDGMNLTENAAKLTDIKCDKDFLLYALQSQIAQTHFKSRFHQVAQPKLSIETASSTPIPLPPLAEQRRIVHSVSHLFPLLDLIEQSEADLLTAVKQAKNKILHLAIRGRLTAQDPADEPASALLLRIRQAREQDTKGNNNKAKNKTKAAKTPHNTANNEDKPFNIPETWEWCRLSDLCTILNGDRGKNYPSKAKLKTIGIPFISAVNLDGHSVIVDERLLCLSEDQYNKLGSGKLIKDDIVVCIRGSLGKHGKYPYERGAIASSLVIVRPHLNEDCISSWIMYYLDTALFQQEVLKYNNGTAQPNLAAKDFADFLIPLPPLAEQRRIVSRIEDLFSAIERIEAAIG